MSASPDPAGCTATSRSGSRPCKNERPRRWLGNGRVHIERLRDILGAVERRFILSINDRPEIRGLRAASNIAAVELGYKVSGKATPARELIITGGKAATALQATHERWR